MIAYKVSAKARTPTFLPHSSTTVACDGLCLKQDCEFVVSLGYTERPCLKNREDKPGQWKCAIPSSLGPSVTTKRCCKPPTHTPAAQLDCSVKPTNPSTTASSYQVLLWATLPPPPTPLLRDPPELRLFKPREALRSSGVVSGLCTARRQASLLPHPGHD